MRLLGARCSPTRGEEQDMSGLQVVRAWVDAAWHPSRRDEILAIFLPGPLVVATVRGRWHRLMFSA
eukprot:9501431-Lingulodinium_polyedra.AAC.1